MARVRFPLIVRKTSNGDGRQRFACEDYDEKGFNWVENQLEGTVYKSSKEFIKFWAQSATSLVKSWNKNYDILNPNHALLETVYVGQ